MLQGHGDDGYRYGRVVRANFSSNVLPGGCPAGLREHVRASVERIGAYPEVAAETLTGLIASSFGVASESVLVTAGGTAAIHLTAQAFRGQRSCVVIPTFAEYEDACVAHDHRLSFLRWSEFADGARCGADLVWLCNPNNPTGAVLSNQRLLERVRAQPETTFVVDAAYADFCEEPPPVVREWAAQRNSVLVHSFTKRFAIPGLRLGCVTGEPGTVARLRRLQPPWAVGALELAAGEYLLRHETHAAEWRTAYLANARELQSSLAVIGGIRPESSATGFFLLELTGGTGADLKSYLLNEHGLLVRAAANFRGLNERWVRIASQQPDENRALVNAIHQWTQS